jgi:hypothetical protein
LGPHSCSQAAADESPVILPTLGPMPHGDVAADDAASDRSEPSFGLCPAEPPVAGDECESPNQGCKYVANGLCLAFVCDGSSHWASTTEGC